MSDLQNKTKKKGRKEESTVKEKYFSKTGDSKYY